MPITVACSTQAELDACCAAGNIALVLKGKFEARDSASVVARDSASVVAMGSASVVAMGSASVVARDSASVVARGSASVVARDSASVVAWGRASVEAWGSASVEACEIARVVARGRASVVAWDSASVEAWDRASVEAMGNVFLRLFGGIKIRAAFSVQVLRHRSNVTVEGEATVREAYKPTTPQEWCDFHGVEIKDGIATLFKAVDDDYSTERARKVGIVYAPGQTPVAPDWDGGKIECGAGLHFSPTPHHTREFHSDPKHFMACPVALTDMVVHPDGTYPQKVKARAVALPIFEVDRRGNLLSPPHGKATS